MAICQTCTIWPVLLPYKFSCNRDSYSDCGGKLCKNGGTLDLATCMCSCTSSKMLTYGGDECEKRICPTIYDPEDPSLLVAKLSGENCEKGRSFVGD